MNRALRPLRHVLSRTFLWRVLSGAFCVFAYAMLGLVCLLTVLPRVSDIEVRRVVSGSMEPGIAVNDIAVTRAVSANDISAGDVILFDAPARSQGFLVPAEPRRQPVLHRVIHVVENENGVHFETRGDNNGHPDDWLVPAASVRGELLFHVPYAGYLFLFLSSRLGYVLCVVLPGFAIMLPELLFIFRWIRYGEALQPTAEPQPGTAS